MAERDYNKMDGDQQFQLRAYALLALAVIAIVACITLGSIWSRSLRADAIKTAIEHRVDPQSVNCAFGIDGSELAVCTQLAGKAWSAGQ